ncbi:hypothetical protein BGZ82_000448 [Podila clonocystis]|nr:hypothetical protein BGZ82_000448 [Podila clonocystis]
MFDVPEIDRIVCLQLGRRELFQCTQVNSAWYETTMPFLWINLSNLSSFAQQQALRKLVLIDYIQEQKCLGEQRAQEEEPLQGRAAIHNNESSSRPLAASTVYCPSLIEEYGVNVVHIPAFYELRRSLILMDPRKFRVLDYERKSEMDLALVVQFFKRCPNIKIPTLSVLNDLKDLCWHNVISLPFLVPVTQALLIGLEEEKLYGPSVSMSDMDDILAAASDSLESLAIGANVSSGSGATKWNCQAGLVRLKELKLFAARGVTAFWSRVWEGCCRIEHLQVYRIDTCVLQSLAGGIREHMTHLSSIRFGNRLRDDDDIIPRLKPRLIRDEEAARLIDAGTKGWRVVKSDAHTIFGPLSMTSLIQHYSTLVEVKIVQCVGGSSVITLLQLCPYLQSLVSSDAESSETEDLSGNPVLDFIDRDPINNSLRPWMCESRLNKLKLRITDVPLEEDEDYPGQRKDIHAGVYARLARLTQLEVLSLGYQPIGQDVEDIPFSITVDSGLGSLAGLKNMKKLKLDGLDHNMGSKDFEWISKHWPNETHSKMFRFSTPDWCILYT